MYRSQIPDEFSVSVGIPTDEDGYFDRECPNEKCQAAFKIIVEDWKEKVRDEEVFCPVCGHTAASDKWFTEAQIEHMQSAFMAQFQPVLDTEMQRMALDFNRGMPKGGLISMSMSYKPSHPVAVIPIEALDLMRQRYVCEECGCRYAAIGAAFFCPACGHNSARTGLQQTLALVRRLPEIQKALENGLDRDAAENACRITCEECMGKLVATFQRFAEATFDALPNRASFTPRRNLFQNLADSSDLWEQAIGVGYETMLEPREWDDLKRFFQQRHLLAHKDGIVDEDYRNKTGDQHYQPGQRLIIRMADVLRFTDLVEKLSHGLLARLNHPIKPRPVEGAIDD